MVDPTASDDDAIAELRRRERRANRGVYLIALAPVAGGAIIAIDRWDNMGASSRWVLAVAGAVLLAGLGWLLWQRPPLAAYGPRIIARRTDEIQRGRARQLWAYPVLILCFTPQIIAATRYVIDGGGPKLLGLPRGVATVSYLSVIAITLLVTVVATWMMLMGTGYPQSIRTVMDDELSRDHRAKATASGFAAALVGGIAAFAAGLIEPRWAVLGLPFVITGALAVAAVHFALMDRRAGLDV
jgi:hypothetical protein